MLVSFCFCTNNSFSKTVRPDKLEIHSRFYILAFTLDIISAEQILQTCVKLYAQQNILSIVCTQMLDSVYHIAFNTVSFVVIPCFAVFDTMFTTASILMSHINDVVSIYNLFLKIFQGLLLLFSW